MSLFSSCLRRASNGCHVSRSEHLEYMQEFASAYQGHVHFVGCQEIQSRFRFYPSVCCLLDLLILLGRELQESLFYIVPNESMEVYRISVESEWAAFEEVSTWTLIFWSMFIVY